MSEPSKEEESPLIKDENTTSLSENTNQVSPGPISRQGFDHSSESTENLISLLSTTKVYNMESSGSMSAKNVFRAKNKNPSWFNCIQQNFKSSIRYIILFLFVFATCYFSLLYFDLYKVSQTTIPKLDKDRSTSYRVKVIPASLGDSELVKLPKETFSYLAMIDAGSSGCRAHVYRYGKLGSIEGPLYVLPEHQSKKVKPGLSSFSKNPKDAGKSLVGLVDFIKEQVPEVDWGVTPIWLKATAGLRMLPPENSEDILNSVRDFLEDKKNSPFVFRRSWAKIISGNEEGGFGWIAFNYLKKIIGPKKAGNESPFAVIEMGGASAQVSQLAPNVEEANKIPQDYKFSFEIEGQSFDLYTHSYLGYGAEQARSQFSKLLDQKLIFDEGKATDSDPCIAKKQDRYLAEDSTSPAPPSDLKAKISDILGKCVKSVASLFSPSMLEALGKVIPEVNNVAKNLRKTSTCPTNGPYSFGCVYQPPFVAASDNILTFENFFYMSSALGVKPHRPSISNASSVATVFPLVTSPKLIRDASDSYCSLDSDSIEKTYPKDSQPKDVNGKMCFLSAFSYSFLVDGVKIPSDKLITIQKEVENSEIEWALGAAYKETADFLKRKNLRPT